MGRRTYSQVRRERAAVAVAVGGEGVAAVVSRSSTKANRLHVCTRRKANPPRGPSSNNLDRRSNLITRDQKAVDASDAGAGAGEGAG